VIGHGAQRRSTIQPCSAGASTSRAWSSRCTSRTDKAAACSACSAARAQRCWAAADFRTAVGEADCDHGICERGKLGGALAKHGIASRLRGNQKPALALMPRPGPTDPIGLWDLFDIGESGCSGFLGLRLGLGGMADPSCAEVDNHSAPPGRDPPPADRGDYVVQISGRTMKIWRTLYNSSMAISAT
jgi:hypothetical protein